MAVRRPGVERPETGQDAAAEQEHGEQRLLEALRELDAVEGGQVEGAEAGLDEDG